MEEVLNERKQKNLKKQIIKTYMETGEPVGSRTIPSMRISMSVPQRSEMKCQT